MHTLAYLLDYCNTLTLAASAKKSIISGMSTPELVGIVNVTPDSFSDGGQYLKTNIAVTHAGELFHQGVSKVDIGGESTRPGATPLTPEEEWSRISAVVGELIPVYGESTSVDTHHPEIVEKCALLGQFVVNDVTGFNNPKMRETAINNQLPVIVSHLPKQLGQDIQAAHQEKPVDSISQVSEELHARAEELQQEGLRKDLITLDPGIGFGKTMTLNWKLLRFAVEAPEYPVMIGHSNKRFLKTFPTTGREPSLLAKLSDKNVEAVMQMANRKAARIAIQAGTKYLRVHDPRLYKDLV